MRSLYKIFGVLVVLIGIGFSSQREIFAATSCATATITACCTNGWKTLTWGSCQWCETELDNSGFYMGVCPSSDQVCAAYGASTAPECQCRNNCPVDDDPNCNDCTVSCPSPLTSSGDGDLILTNYANCSHSSPCDGPIKYINCYEPNTNRTQPTRDYFYMYSNPGFVPPWGTPFLPTSLGFTSSTITGAKDTGANRPFIIDTQFSDPNGSADIETMGVWFRDTVITAQYPSSIGTPYYIDTNSDSGLSGKSYGDNTWGFLLHKEGGTYPNETWVPYVIAVNPDGVNHKWVKAYKYPNNGGFAIPSNDGLEVVRIGGLNLTATDIPLVTTTSSNRRLRFSVMVNENNRARNVSYDIYTISHDKFSFTPYDNYLPVATNILSYWNNEEIRNNTRVRDAGEPDYARQWVDTGSNWRIDSQVPSINPLTYTTSGTNVLLSWQGVVDQVVSPNLASGIYGVVINIYRGSGTVSGQTVTINGTSYDPPSLPSLPLAVAGNLNPNSSAYQNISSSALGSINIGLSNFTKGSLIIYATVFDNGGNIARQNISIDLSDWAITQGDLFYSSLGTDFDVKGVSPDTAWDSTKLKGFFLPSTADISSELYAEKEGLVSKLKKSSTNSSYAILKYSKTLPSPIYEEYKNSFDERKDGIENIKQIYPISPIMSGNLSTYCTGVDSLCYGEFETLTINESFVCNGKAIFFVSGNLVINPNITNGLLSFNRDACMFVVGGDVTINQGANSSLSGFNYDEINAFIVADGTITINSDVNGDGLLVKGGLISTSTVNPSIIIGRHLPIAQRNTFPVLAVSAHPKYPPTSKIFIGTPLNVVNTDVGFKGY